MSTRAQVRFATREEGVTFNEHPEKIHAQFYVHSDGYPEGLGVEIAESILDSTKLSRWEIEHLDTKHGDLEYIYYIWQKPQAEAWISIFEVTYGRYCHECGKDYEYGNTYRNEDKCIFVGRPDKLIGKYKLNTNNDG
tara:strand:- start:1323 stop:1733 length:411 start_codon:yes stop_codon:yes gene_type:complete